MSKWIDLDVAERRVILRAVSEAKNIDQEWCIFRHRNGPTGIMFACILLPPTGANNTKNEISHNLCENYNHLTQSEIQNSHNL